MKSLRIVPFIILMSLASMAVAQSDARKSGDQPAPKSEAQRSFDAMKTLAGVWQGPVKVDPPMGEMENTSMQVSLRVTSRGNAMVHEMKEAGKPYDPTRYDNPITMFYIDGDRLFLTHYCDAGNRPRMTGKVSPDGKKVEFDFVDFSGGNQYGHMYHALFTIIDADHHTEDWTFMMPGDKSVLAHFDLKRAQ